MNFVMSEQDEILEIFERIIWWHQNGFLSVSQYISLFSLFSIAKQKSSHYGFTNKKFISKTLLGQKMSISNLLMCEIQPKVFDAIRKMSKS